MTAAAARAVALARRVARTPPRRLARAVVRRGRTAVAGPLTRTRDGMVDTHPPLPDAGTVRFARLLGPPRGSGSTRPDGVAGLLADGAPPGERAAVSLWLRGDADLLGSGWVQMAHGAAVPGLAGIVFPSPPVEADRDGRWLSGHVPPRTLARAQAAWRLVSPGHVPVDWHRDHRSGFRWDPSVHRDLIRYGDVRGADVKGPWELARAQHLPVMAAHGLAGPVTDQILDFIATNPPRFGVNWSCTMDVGIRVANWLVALDLLAAGGHRVAPAALRHIGASVEAHARFIAAHLEWFPDLRSNHYLANLAGLLACAAYLPRTAQSDAWLAFAAAELAVEADLQFLPDGSCFEGSTSYHRLSGELLAWSVVLLRAVPGVAERLASAAVPGSVDPRLLPSVPGLAVDLPAAGRLLDEETDDRLRAIARFALACRTPDGLTVQVGDTDSGRHLKLSTSWAEDTPPAERHGDHMALVAAIGGLLDDGHLVESAGPVHRRSAVAAAGGRRAGSGDARSSRSRARAARDRRGGGSGAVRAPRRPAGGSAMPVEGVADHTDEHVAVVDVVPGGDGLDEGLAADAFEDFGLFIHRSARLWLSIRCGPVGQRGNGGHAHADQLSIELWIDGTPWVRDPGTFVYTPLPEVRNAYRSVGTHLAPRVGDLEPNPLDAGLFTMADTTTAQVLSRDERTFVGRHHGFGRPVVRQVEILPDRVRILDRLPSPPSHHGQRTVRSPEELQALLPSQVPHSPAYGVQERSSPLAPC